VKYLSDQFEITSGPVDYFVGLEISRDRNKKLIHVSQQSYVKKILARLGVEDYPYQEAVGSLMFAASCSRPDISYAVGQVAKFSSEPTRTHWNAVKRIFAYLKHTSSVGISYYEEGENHLLKAFSDADWGGDTDDGTSTTGNIFILKGGPVAWSSQNQKCVSLSTAESEYVAACITTKEVVENQLADALTKNVDYQKLSKFKLSIGMCSLSNFMFEWVHAIYLCSRLSGCVGEDTISNSRKRLHTSHIDMYPVLSCYVYKKPLNHSGTALCVK
jgi:hypothetical protein